MMRLITYLLGGVAVLLAGMGLLAFDYTMASRAAHAAGTAPVGFLSHLDKRTGFSRMLPFRVADAPELAAMLPPAPEGWTQRRLSAADRAAYPLDGLDDADATRIAAVFDDGNGEDVRIARRSYDHDGQVVVMEVTLYPAALVTDPAMAETLQAVQAEAADFATTEVAVLRGFALREAALTAAAPARVLGGDIAAQIQLRVIAPADVTTETLLPLIAGLDVAAMNTAIAVPVDGIGMDPPAAPAVAGAAADPASAPPAPEVTVHRGAPARGDKPASLFGGECRVENGRKICGTQVPGG